MRMWTNCYWKTDVWGVEYAWETVFPDRSIGNSRMAECECRTWKTNRCRPQCSTPLDEALDHARLLVVFQCAQQWRTLLVRGVSGITMPLCWDNDTLASFVKRDDV